MRKLLSILVLLWSMSCFSALPPGVTGKKIPDWANLAVPPGTYMFLVSDPSGNYFNITVAQLQALGTNSSTIIITNASFQYLTNLYAYITNLYSTNITAYALVSDYITANYITNNYAYITNLYSTTNISNTTITTNLTINSPGGATNLNLTPKSVMWSDVNDAEGSIPNASGVLTNDGSGGIGFSDSISLTEMDVLNFYPTNMFTGLTNYSVLGTDGDGKLTLGSATNSFTATTIYAETNFVDYNYTTNLFYVSGKGNTLIITNVSVENTLTNKGVGASSAVITDSHQVETNAVNVHGVFTNTASGPPSFGLLQNTELQSSTITIQGSAVALGGSTLAAGSSPSFNAINFTNSGYSLPTNNVGGGAFVFGGPGTAATFYDTNITAATTLKLFDITACSATVGGIKLYVTCSGGTDRILTFPAGCSGAGLGTPPAVTITNAKAAFFDIIYKPGATPVTNVFWSPVY